MPKTRENIDDSGSSDDEMINKALQEATDTQFLKKSMFDDEETSADKQKLSSRKCNDAFEGFKDFLAKRLTELLDRNIEMTEKTFNSKRKRRRLEDEESVCGIRLLRTSGNFIKNVDINASSHHCTSRFRIKNVENMTSKDNLLRCKEAAVDPQWILSKVETKFWSEKQKGRVYEYKMLPDGTLVEK